MAGKRDVIEGVDLHNASDISSYIGREILRSTEAPNLLQYLPHPKQKKFHQSGKPIRLYIGGNRSGKSTGGVVEDLFYLRKQHPEKYLPISPSEPCRGRVIAVDFVNGIDKIILPQFAQWTPKSMLIHGSWTQSYDKAHRTLNFANGSFCEFMSYDQDLDKFAGTSRHFIHFDEEPPQPIYVENYARVIDTGGHMWITMTPVEGMTWVYDTIYEPGILGSELFDVIVVDMTENPYLDTGAINRFLAGLSPEEREARVHGRFVQMGGLIYKHFDPKPGGMHVIEGGFTPDEHWKVGLGLDHGFNNPTAVGFHAYNSDGDVVTFDEHYASGMTVAENADAIKKKMFLHGIHPQQVEIMIADPSIKAVTPISGTSVQSEYARLGLYWALGNNDVSNGIIQVSQYFRARNGRARLRFSDQVKNHIREHARYRWKTYDTKAKNFEYNVFEEPHKKDDHTCDELRYFLMSRPDIFLQLQPKGPKIGQGFEAPSSSKGRMTVGEMEREAMEWEEGHFQRDYYNLGGGVEYDEHMGGIW